MPCNLKSASFSLVITVLLLFMLTGCDFLNHAKPDAVIEIDLNKPGKTFPKDLYGKVEENLNCYSKAKVGDECSNLKTTLNMAAQLIALENNIFSVGPVSDSSLFLNLKNMKTWIMLKDDHLRPSFKTPGYYAFKMFSDNQPDKQMPLKVILIDEDNSVKGISATAGIHEKSGIVIIKLVNPDNIPKHCRIVLKYKQQVKYKGEVIVLTSGNSMDGNSAKEPEKVVPMTKDVNGLRNTFNYECPANSIVIIHLRYKKGINGFVNCC